MKSRMKDYPTSLSTPIDSTAARVTSKGTHYQVNRKETGHIEVWDTPPPTLPIPSNIKSFLGQKHGRVTIVGYLGAKRAGETRWLARCSCGKYSVRASERWRKNKNPDRDMCPDCNSFESRKRWYEKSKHFELTGKWPDD